MKKCTTCGEVFNPKDFSPEAEYCWNCYSLDLKVAEQETNENLEQS